MKEKEKRSDVEGFERRPVGSRCIRIQVPTH